MRKKAAAVVLAIMVGVSLIGCGGGSGTDSTTQESSDTSSTEGGENSTKDTLSIATPGDPSTFAPNDTFNDFASFATQQIYEKLFYTNTDGEYEYRAATSVEQEDETHILIKLREGVTDTNGNELTASDVLFDIEHALGTVFSSQFTNIDLDNCEIIDDYTLRLALYETYSMQLPVLATLALFDEDSYNASTDEMVMTPVGYGPYYLDSYTAGTEVVLKARDDYWDGEPQLKTVTYKIITEATQRTNALVSGSVDMALEIQISDVEYIDGNDRTSVLQKEGYASHGIVFNCDAASPLNDIHLRRAIAYAINEEAINQVSYEGTSNIPVSMFSTGVNDYDEAAWAETAEKYGNYYAYDLDKAKEEMALSQYADGVTLQAIHYTANNGGTNSELVQSMLSEIGITLEITAYDNATVNDMLVNEPEKWDMAFSGWYAGARYSAAIAALQIAGNNFCNWSGSEFDTYCEAVKKAETAATKEELVEDCLTIVDMSSEYLPFMNLADYKTMIGLTDGLDISFYENHMFDLSKMTWS
ncbi:MAG: ABC transporter substrate-binding protein [Lachnospiraceae bacterium]